MGPLRRALLRWYDAHRRDLPWRPPRKGCPVDPYHVLVSEAMLQQTQVATVRGYFERFIAELPTLGALAAAEEQRVLRLWQGLGYYRRARHLHAAAMTIVRQYGGDVPDTASALRQLPGVGRYSAGAIASIAFGRREPVVDGNVGRVLARLFGIAEPIDAVATRSRLWDMAGELVSPTRPGDFNQAMMELGATVCTPRNPACDRCPLRTLCATRGDALPVKVKRVEPKAVTHTVIAVERGGRFLFEQRNADGLWANMWQLPTAESRIEPAAWVAERFGLSIEPPRRVDSFTHQTTHRTIRFRVLRAPAAGRLRRGAGRWRKLGDLDDLPLPNPQRRAVALLGGAPRGRGG